MGLLLTFNIGLLHDRISYLTGCNLRVVLPKLLTLLFIHYISGFFYMNISLAAVSLPVIIIKEEYN